jgi:hypothetical protein
VFHIEDLHEASFERTELILALAQKVLHLPGVGLIVTSRSKPLPPFEAIRLEPLNRLETAHLLEVEAGAPLPPEALDWVFLRALGNPLFTLEYFRFLSRQGFLYNDGKRWRWRDPEREVVPVTVEALIERVLQPASQHPNLERLIGVKAMLGFQAPNAVLFEVLGISLQELQNLENELEGRGILRRGEFAHPLYRELGLGNLAIEARRQMARRAFKMSRRQRDWWHWHNCQPKAPLTCCNVPPTALEPRIAPFKPVVFWQRRAPSVLVKSVPVWLFKPPSV